MATDLGTGFLDARDVPGRNTLTDGMQVSQQVSAEKKDKTRKQRNRWHGSTINLGEV